MLIIVMLCVWAHAIITGYYTPTEGVLYLLFSPSGTSHPRVSHSKYDTPEDSTHIVTSLTPLIIASKHSRKMWVNCTVVLPLCLAQVLVQAHVHITVVWYLYV